jgi:hypothetical protein
MMSTDTDTDATATTDTTAEPAKKVAARDVIYGFEEYMELPETQRAGGSLLEDALTKIKEDVIAGTKKSDAFYKIGDYRVGSACTSAATQLRRRHGDAFVEGFTFASRKLESGRRGLFVNYNPEKVVEGGRAVWDEEVAKGDAKREAKREARANKSEAAAAAEPVAEPDPVVTRRARPTT